MAGTVLLEAKVHAQAAPPTFKQREVKIKGQVEQDKLKEKTKARSPKAEKPDFGPIEEYYRDFLIPSLTQDAPDQINNARKQILDDIDTIEKNKELSGKFSTYFVKEMRDLALRGADGKTYSAPARINAANLVGRLNSPEPAVLKSILDFVDQKDNDGVVSSGMTSFLKHVKNPQVTEQVRGVFVQHLQVHLTTPAPVTRDPEAQNYLTSQVIECLTEIAKLETDKDKEKGPAKLATAVLTPALIKIIDEQKSEWLVETALTSFGTIKHTNVSAEDAVVLEKAIAKFIKQSIKDWKNRIANSGALAGGGSEYGGGGGQYGSGSSPGGMSSGGPAGGSKKGGASSSGGGEGMEGGYPGGGGSGGGAPAKPKRPFEDQPKEVKNARRIAHQRFEKIHLALNGLFLNPTFKKKPEDKEKAKDKADRALLVWIPAIEKETLTKLLDKVDQFQKDLNDDKVTDLTSLNLAVKKSLTALRADCDEILGEKKEVILEKDEDNFGI